MAIEWFTIRWDMVAKFKRETPCHGLPDNLDSLSCAFDGGKFVSVQAFDANGEWLDTFGFNEASLYSLTLECWRFGDKDTIN